MKAVFFLPYVKRIASLCALSIGVAGAFFCAPAIADDDPFQIEGGHWMSFDHYKDADKRGILPPPLPAARTTEPASTDVAAGVDAAASPTPAVAPPTRPLNLPPMPALGKGFMVQVNSTEDDAAAQPPPVIAADTAPDIKPVDKNWQNPASVAGGHKDANGDDDIPPLSVRMSYLPDSRIMPVPTPDKMTANHAARIALEKGMVRPKAAASPAEVATTAAIDAFKKQQLNAIESDRQTLKALQDAISTLGLQKKLDFMTGGDGSLSASVGQTANGNSPPDKPVVR